MRNVALCVLGIVGLSLAGGCSTSPGSPDAREALQDQSQATLKEMANKDATLRSFLDRSVGYAIFPDVGKGAFIVGGSYGKGVVYENGHMIGYADITSGSVGLQAGGESFAELIVFENQNAINRLKAGNWDLGAKASAILLKAGAGASTRFENGVAVFTMPKGGLMADLSVAGQRFRYTPAATGGYNHMDRTDTDRRMGTGTTQPARMHMETNEH